MSWKPTQGMKRAITLTDEIMGAGIVCGAYVGNEPYGPLMMFRARMTELLTQAIDQALKDGSEQDALASMVGNGHTERVVAHLASLPPIPKLYPTTFDDTPEYRAMFPDDPRLAEAGEGDLGQEIEKSKKRRGRPPGKKAKKAKAAKAEPAADANL